MNKLKLKQYVKVQAHCRECVHCDYDLFFIGYRCLKRKMSVQLISLACANFVHILRESDPDWAEKFIFTTERTW